MIGNSSRERENGEMRRLVLWDRPLPVHRGVGKKQGFSTGENESKTFPHIFHRDVHRERGESDNGTDAYSYRALILAVTSWISSAISGRSFTIFVMRSVA